MSDYLKPSLNSVNREWRFLTCLIPKKFRREKIFPWKVSFGIFKEHFCTLSRVVILKRIYGRRLKFFLTSNTSYMCVKLRANNRDAVFRKRNFCALRNAKSAYRVTKLSGWNRHLTKVYQSKTNSSVFENFPNFISVLESKFRHSSVVFSQIIDILQLKAAAVDWAANQIRIVVMNLHDDVRAVVRPAEWKSDVVWISLAWNWLELEFNWFTFTQTVNRFDSPTFRRPWPNEINVVSTKRSFRNFSLTQNAIVFVQTLKAPGASFALPLNKGSSTSAVVSQWKANMWWTNCGLSIIGSICTMWRRCFASSSFITRFQYVVSFGGIFTLSTVSFRFFSFLLSGSSLNSLQLESLQLYSLLRHANRISAKQLKQHDTRTWITNRWRWKFLSRVQRLSPPHPVDVHRSFVELEVVLIACVKLSSEWKSFSIVFTRNAILLLVDQYWPTVVTWSCICHQFFAICLLINAKVGSRKFSTPRKANSEPLKFHVDAAQTEKNIFSIPINLPRKRSVFNWIENHIVHIGWHFWKKKKTV